MKVEVLSEALLCQLGEGPHWSVAEGVLYYVDIKKGRVLRYDPRNGGSCCYVDVSPPKSHISSSFFLVKTTQYINSSSDFSSRFINKIVCLLTILAI